MTLHVPIVECDVDWLHFEMQNLSEILDKSSPIYIIFWYMIFNK